jgi:hypothetical protein
MDAHQQADPGDRSRDDVPGDRYHFGHVSPAGSTYPGSKAYESLITKECPARLQKVIVRDAPALSWTGDYPELPERTSGDRSIKCLLISTDGKPLRRSVVA